MTASVVLNPSNDDRRARQRSRTAPSRLQAAACGLGLALGVCGAAVAIPLVQSGVAAFQTERVLVAWSENDHLPPGHLWDQLLQRADQAVAGYPAASGEYLDRLGRAHLWGAIIYPEDATHWQQAAASFRASVTVRPDWPWSWLRLAHAKLQGSELDDEFDHALRQAFLLGSGRLELNQDLARMGFSVWRELTIEQRALVLQAAERVVARSENHAKAMQQVAQAAGIGSALCWAVDSSIKTRHHICKEDG
ncbi:hypothetical protein SAMN05216421_2551 [Halopseudomonas xinjiangensis]|uniref:Uncharacterized protein n=1 Tax=Halopseudomonas xinjiangensis TaxID=487184 RepID=A0A1H1WD40_9GAMM|nr:hypothetical protein [Halopseudomonas xinjiangensis]SDS95043.1 hypothetical protein SAMN05216421_2551 [Halopseudomonas xinjiangensis]